MHTTLRFFTLVAVTCVAFACSSGGTTGTGTTDSADSGSSSDGAFAGDTSSTSAEGGGGAPKSTGLKGFCEHYFECGGSYYKDVDDCIQASVDHWKACRRPELDAFGDCMMGVECKDWNPDTYNPASTKCSSQWSSITQKQC
ncbi:MAG: hypothetical protein U0174_28550 [Polyangiaceae bacterium]